MAQRAAQQEQAVYVPALRELLGSTPAQRHNPDEDYMGLEERMEAISEALVAGVRDPCRLMRGIEVVTNELRPRRSTRSHPQTSWLSCPALSRQCARSWARTSSGGKTTAG
jgi:hypothetical protein